MRGEYDQIVDEKWKGLRTRALDHVESIRVCGRRSPFSGCDALRVGTAATVHEACSVLSTAVSSTAAA